MSNANSSFSPSTVSALDPEVIHTSFIYTEIKRYLESPSKSKYELPNLTPRETKLLRHLLKRKLEYCQWIGGVTGQEMEAKIEGIVLASYEMDKRNLNGVSKNKYSDFAPRGVFMRFLASPTMEDVEKRETRSCSLPGVALRTPVRSRHSATTQAPKTKSTPPSPNAAQDSKPVVPFKRLIQNPSWPSWWKSLSWRAFFDLTLRFLFVVLSTRYVCVRGMLQVVDDLGTVVLLVLRLVFGILTMFADGYLAWWRGVKER